MLHSIHTQPGEAPVSIHPEANDRNVRLKALNPAIEAALSPLGRGNAPKDPDRR